MLAEPENKSSGIKEIKYLAKFLLIVSIFFIIFAPLVVTLILINSPMTASLIFDVNLVLFGSITYAVIISTSLLYQIWKKKAADAKRGGDLEC